MQPDLLSWRPSEPTAGCPEKFRRAKGEPRDYAREFAAFIEAHPSVADHIRRSAIDLLLAGVERISVALLFEQARAELKVSINTSYAAAASDWLCATEPRLRALIERRRRRTTK